MCSGSKPGEEGEEKEEEKEERCARGCKSHYSDRQPTNSSTPGQALQSYRQEGGILRLGGAVVYLFSAAIAFLQITIKTVEKSIQV